MDKELLKEISSLLGTDVPTHAIEPVAFTKEAYIEMMGLIEEFEKEKEEKRAREWRMRYQELPLITFKPSSVVKLTIT